MKTTIITFVLAVSSTFAIAQKIALAGTVNDTKGAAVPYAFIKDANHNYATYSDGFGNFSLRVDTLDRLLVSANTFKGMTVKVTDPQKVAIVMTSDGSNAGLVINPETFKERLSNEGMTKSVATGYIAHENSLHGTRYFFDHWVHGFSITAEDSIKQSSGSLYNYEKMDGSLLYTTDGKNMQAIDRSMIKRFTLVDDQGTYVFENVPAIDPKHYVQVLATGGKYKIYKQFNTRFFPNDYVSNGMTSTGHNYDEIKDEPEYYVVKVPGGSPQKIALKSKALKTVFAAEGAKVNKYLSDHDGDIDDAYLTALGDYLNN